MTIDFWKEESSADFWVQNSHKYNKEAIRYLMKQDIEDFDSILEFGAGDGSIIEKFIGKKECLAVEINPKLRDIISYQLNFKVDIYESLKDLPDNSVDLIFTHQCLTCIEPKYITEIVEEMLRVAKKEVWLMEGFYPATEKKTPAFGVMYNHSYQRFYPYEIENVRHNVTKIYKILV